MTSRKSTVKADLSRKLHVSLYLNEIKKKITQIISLFFEKKSRLCFHLGQYLNSQRNCNGPMCALPCEERSPSCEGMRDGNNTFIGRELSPFYISCFKERTLSVGICRYGVYDPNLRFCTTELDPCKKFFPKFQILVV